MSRVIEIPFNDGQDEGTDRALLPDGKFTMLRNCRLARDGRLEVRPAYTAVANSAIAGGTITPTDLTSYCGDLVAMGNFAGLAYSQQLFTYLGASKWAPQLDFSEMQMPHVTEIETFFSAPYGNVMSNADVAYANGYLAVVTTDAVAATAGIYVVHVATRRVVQRLRLTATTSVRCCAVGTLFVFVNRTSAGNLVARSLSTASISGGFSGTTNLVVAELTDAFGWDLAPLTGTSDFLVSFARTAANAMRLRRYTTAFAVVNTLDVAATRGNSCVIGSTTTGVHWAINVGNNTVLRTLSSALAVTVGPTNVLGPLFGSANVIGTPALELVTVSPSAPAVVVSSPSTGALGIDDTASSNWTVAAHANTGFSVLPNTRIASKLYAHIQLSGSNAVSGIGTLIVGGNTSGTDQVYASCIQKIQGSQICARWNYGFSDKLDGPSSSDRHGRPSIATDAAGKYWGCVGLIDEAGVGTTDRGTLQIVQFKSGAAERRQSAETAGALYISGGFTYYYSGGQIPAESGFLDTPVISGTVQAAGGGLTLLGVYNYTACYEWLDERGYTHRSTPSAPLPVTMTGANNRVTVSISSPRSVRTSTIGDANAVKVVLYRTVAGDSLPFRVGDTSVSAYGSVVSIQDGVTDIVAETKAVLYTTSQKPIANVAPLPCRFIAAGKDRLIMAGHPDPYLVTFSQVAFPGEPLEGASPNNFSFQMRMPGPVTGVAVFGVSYLVFTADAIYEIPGTGPQRNGSGEFLPPVPLDTDVGCVDWRSIVVTGAGVFFQGATDKLYVLAGGKPAFIGKPVRDTLKAFPVVTGAALCSETQQVVFSCVDSATAPTAGVLLVYDTLRQVWFVDDVGPVTAITEYQGRLALLSGGVVSLEDSAIALGGGALPTMSVRTGSFRPFSAMGCGTICKIGLLGTYLGDCTVEGFISYDDGKTWTSMGTRAVTAATPALGSPVTGNALSSGDPTPIIFTPKRREVDRFALRFDVTNATNTGGIRMHAISLEVEGREGTTRKGEGWLK